MLHHVTPLLPGNPSLTFAFVYKNFITHGAMAPLHTIHSATFPSAKSHSAKCHRSYFGIATPLSLTLNSLANHVVLYLQADLTVALWVQIGAELRRTISVLGPACGVSMC